MAARRVSPRNARVGETIVSLQKGCYACRFVLVSTQVGFDVLTASKTEQSVRSACYILLNFQSKTFFYLVSISTWKPGSDRSQNVQQP